MIHPACVTAVRDVIILNTQQHLPNFYACYFQSPNILYRCSVISIKDIKYVISYCPITLHLTTISINSTSYQYQ